MVTAVVVLNGILAMICWLGAWRCWQVRGRVRHTGEILATLERLAGMMPLLPMFLKAGQGELEQAAQGYARWQGQWRQVGQGLQLLQLGGSLWRWRSPRV